MATGQPVHCGFVQVRLAGNGAVTERPDSMSYRERAAICAQCAEQAVSTEAKAALLYLSQMWNDVAEIVDAFDGKPTQS
jgi:hypothetical protein